MNRTNEAAAAYQQAIHLDPRYTEAKAYLARLGKSGGQDESVIMAGGVSALYTRRDPNAAIVQFRKVLEINPNHYGATFQLAMALDQAGKSTEARPLWKKALDIAEASKDADTANTARARLAKADGATTQLSQDETMKKGLDLLYGRNNPNAAAAEFRKVLESNPAHYGATFQLAMSLDRAGKAAEARPLWEKMLKMAADINDRETVATARDRLQKRP
jgi:tetratricopeptide (TPR) repeat protein